MAPTYFAFYDPNYSNLYESIEITFIPQVVTPPPPPTDIPWTATVNTTGVDAFGFPIQIAYYSYDSMNPTAKTLMTQDPNALPSGFGVGFGTSSSATTRDEIINSLVNGLTTEDMTGASPPVWPRLAVPFYTDPYGATGFQTYLRILSPKQGLGNTTDATYYGITPQQYGQVSVPGSTQFKNYNYPQFPQGYLTGDSTGTYGAGANSFLDNLFNYYTGANLYISTGGASATIYEGVLSGVIGNQTLTFTAVSGPNSSPAQVNALVQANMFTEFMYSGAQLMTNVTLPMGQGSDADNLGFFFGDVFTVGFLPSTIGTMNTSTMPPNSPINVTDANFWQPFYIPDYYIPQYSISGGPWMDLYAKLLHAVAVRNVPPVANGDLNGVGLCYGYDFDDSLGISGAITPASTTSNTLNPYLGITLGAIDTMIPDPYSDPNIYRVTFTFDSVGGNTLEYFNYMSMMWVPILNGGFIFTKSNRTDRLTIRYTNNDGTHTFDMYLVYQFMQPLDTYNSGEISVINSSTMSPTTGMLITHFLVNLSP